VAAFLDLLDGLSLIQHYLGGVFHSQFAPFSNHFILVTSLFFFAMKKYAKCIST